MDGRLHAHRALASRTLVALVAVLTLAVSGCGFVIGRQFPRTNPASRVHVLTPFDRSQADRSGTVGVTIRVDAPLDPATLRVVLTTGQPSTPTVVDLTNRFTRNGSLATATLQASDLRAGLTTIAGRATRAGHRYDARDRAFATFSWEPALDLSSAQRCDVIDPEKCLLPFPNNWFTVADSHTDTGRRVNFAAESMPANNHGVHVDPTQWNRNDGFSPGAMILTYVPHVDLAKTGAAPITDIGRSLNPNQPIVLLDADTGQRWPFFAELDAQADPLEGAVLVIRPAKNLTEGHRYVVALRNMRDGNGAIIPAGRGFAIYRDGIPTFDPTIEQRRPQMESIFRSLGRAGVARSNLYLAWDFTVASERNVSAPVLHIRDDAFSTLHGNAPAFTVSNVQDNVDAQIVRRVTGTFTVPNYLTGTGATGSTFNYGPDGLPQRNGTMQASFICNIPRATTADGNDPVHPARAGVYGHGLLGSNTEVNAGNVEAMSNEHDFVFCATKWIGFSDEDVGTALAALQDFSNFPKLADRTQQSFLNFLFLAELMRSPKGFVTNAAFQAGASHTPVIATGAVYYDGNSQGGILGGAVTAISNEWTRAVLGVPGMNYSTLLQRSVDFDTYKLFLVPAYPDEMDRMLDYSIVQMLWDRAEADGYAEHMTTNPYPNTPAHTVLLDMAFGDHQVANITTETEARTIGASIREPALAPGRDTAVVPFWGIPPITQVPFGGSALVVWDSGNPAPPDANLPPEPDSVYGPDPHEKPRSQVSARVQKSFFLQPNGVVVDVCGTAPCLAP
jgi:hypothetical protein